MANEIQQQPNSVLKGTNEFQTKRKVNFATPQDEKFALLGEIVPLAVAKTLIQKYKKNHPERSTPPQTTWSVYFSRKDFLELITMMEDANADGANIYLGTYADDESTNPAGKDYRKRNTVVFVLTKDKIDLVDVDSKAVVDDVASTFDHGDLNP